MSTPMFEKSKKIVWLIALMLLVMFWTAACGLVMPADSENPVSEEVAAEQPPAEEPAAEEESSLAWSETSKADGDRAGEIGDEAVSAPASGAVVEEKEVEAAPLMPTASPLATALPAPASADELASFSGEEKAAVVRQADPLRAGEVDDNAQWDDYLLYRRNYSGPQVHERDVNERYIIEVKDGQGVPVLDADVRVFATTGQQREEIYAARTYANGQALFHPLALEIPVAQVERFVVEVQKDNLLEQFTLTRFDAQAATSFAEKWTVTLDTQKQVDSINLDVVFLIDATGSMADEIAQIQSTIFDVSAQIDALPGQPAARYGMVTYRDRGDSFVSNVYEFTPDVRDFSKNLSTVWASGGGDYPESLNEGLHNAINRVEWRNNDTVKIIFLVADAPPHLDYEQDYDYAVEMDQAARHGIKIFPIASSGLDDQGEYIFRQLAQVTMGRFIFLTYAGPTNGGAPGDVTTHHVDEDDYSVENLDALLVRLVEKELAYQNPSLAGVR